MKKAFIDIIDPSEAKGDLARAYRRIGGKRGSIANVHQAQSLNHKAMMAHLDLYMALMYAESPLSRTERELIATVTSVFNGCEYCIVHHYEALLVHWAEAPSPNKLSKGEQLSSKQQDMVLFVKILTQNPTQLVDSHRQSIRNAGYSDREILDIILITGYFNFVNRLVIGAGVMLENQEDREYKY